MSIESLIVLLNSFIESIPQSIIDLELQALASASDSLYDAKIPRLSHVEKTTSLPSSIVETPLLSASPLIIPENPPLIIPENTLPSASPLTPSLPPDATTTPGPPLLLRPVSAAQARQLAEALDAAAASLLPLLSAADPSPTALPLRKDLVALTLRALDCAPHHRLVLSSLPALLAALALDSLAVRDVQALLHCSFLRLHHLGPPAQRQQLLFLRHFLLAGAGSHFRALSLAPSILSHLLCHLQQASSPEPLPDALAVLAAAAQHYPQHFSPTFPSLMDALVGWALDPALSLSLSRTVTAQVACHLAAVIQQFAPHALELLDRLLLDMDLLSLKTDDLPAVSKQLERFSFCFLMIFQPLAALPAPAPPLLPALLSRLLSHCFSQRAQTLRNASSPAWLLDHWHQHCFSLLASLLPSLSPPLLAPFLPSCLKFMLSHLRADLAAAPTYPQIHRWLALLLPLLDAAGPLPPPPCLSDLLLSHAPFHRLLRLRCLSHPPLHALLHALYLRLLPLLREPFLLHLLQEIFSSLAPPLLLSNLRFLTSPPVIAFLHSTGAAVDLILPRCIAFLTHSHHPDALRLILFRLIDCYTQFLSFSSDTPPQNHETLHTTVLWSQLATHFLNAFVQQPSPTLRAYLKHWICRHLNQCLPYLQRHHLEVCLAALPDPALLPLLVAALPTRYPVLNQRIALLLLRAPHCFAGYDRRQLLAKLLFHLPPSSLLFARTASLPHLPLLVTAPPPKDHLPAVLAYLTQAAAPPSSTPSPSCTRETLHDLVQECLESRLTFSLGRPNALFEKIEQAATNSTDALQLYWLAQFANALERSIATVCHAPARSLLPEKVARFFVDHQQVCNNWFARMRGALLRGTTRAQLCPADVLLQAHRVLLKPDSPPGTHHDAFFAIADALFDLRDVDSLASVPLPCAPAFALHAVGHWEEALILYQQHQNQSPQNQSPQNQSPQNQSPQNHLPQYIEACQIALSTWSLHSLPSSTQGLFRPSLPPSHFHFRDDLASPQIEVLLAPCLRAAPPDPIQFAALPPTFGPLHPPLWALLLTAHPTSLDALTLSLRFLRKSCNFNAARQLLTRAPNPLPLALVPEHARLSSTPCDLSALKPALVPTAPDAVRSEAWLLCAKWLQRSPSFSSAEATTPLLPLLAQTVAAIATPPLPSGDMLGLLHHCFEKAALQPAARFPKAWEKFAHFAYQRALATLPQQLDAGGERISLSDSEQAALSALASDLTPLQLWHGPSAATDAQAGSIRVMLRHRVLKHFYTAVVVLRTAIDHMDINRLRVLAFRLLNLLVHFGGAHDDLSALLEQTMAESRPDLWVDLLPQIYVWLGHASASVREPLADLVVRIGEQTPGLVVYSTLSMLARVPHSAHQERARHEMKRVVSLLQERHERMFVNAQSVFAELRKISELPEERWHRVLKSLLSQSAQRDSILKRFERLKEETVYNASTPHETAFAATYRKKIEAAWKRLLKVTDLTETHQVLRNLLGEFTPYLKRCSTLRLSSVSPTLLNLHDAPAFSWMKSIDYVQFQPEVMILPTKTRPRRVHLISEQGVSCPVLLKGGEDLRMDERMMQFIRAANEVLSQHSQSALRNLHAKSYAVVPLTERVGVIEWVEGFQQLFSLYQSRESEKAANLFNASRSYSTEATVKGTHLASKKYQEVALEALQEAQYDPSLPRSSWPLDVLRRIFARLREETPEDVLSEAFWRHSPHAMAWWETTCEFTRTLAVMSIIGYFIGLGDRHLDNILVNFNTGEVMHIDYNVCLDKGKRLHIPETVPFRLTRNLQHAACLRDVSSEDGPFAKACSLTFTSLAAAEELLVGLLCIFIYDPILDWEKPTATNPPIDEVASHHGGSVTLSSSSATPSFSSLPWVCQICQAPPFSIQSFGASIRAYYCQLLAQQGARTSNRLTGPLNHAIAEFNARATRHAEVIALCAAAPDAVPSRDRGRFSIHSTPVLIPPAAGLLSAQLITMRRYGFNNPDISQRVDLIERSARLLDEEQNSLIKDLHRLATSSAMSAELQALCHCHTTNIAPLANLMTTFEKLSLSDIDQTMALCQARAPSPLEAKDDHKTSPAHLLGKIATRLVELQPELQAVESTYHQMEDTVYGMLKEIQQHPILGAESLTVQEIKRYEARMHARRQTAHEKHRTLQPSLDFATKVAQLCACQSSSPFSTQLLSALEELRILVQLYQQIFAQHDKQCQLHPQFQPLPSLKQSINHALQELLTICHRQNVLDCKQLIQSLLDELSISSLSLSSEKLVNNYHIAQSLIDQISRFSDLITHKHESSNIESSHFHLLSHPPSSKILRYHSSAKNSHAQEAISKIQEKMLVPPKTISHQVRSLIDQAISVDNLCQLYEGWIAWF